LKFSSSISRYFLKDFGKPNADETDRKEEEKDKEFEKTIEPKVTATETET